MSIEAFHPGCEVNIWHRTRFGGDVSHYRIESLSSIGDLTFGDNAGVTVSKGLYDPAGEFQVRLPDMPLKILIDGTAHRESLYGLLEPMDLIEIRMNRQQLPAGRMPVVLRGFVRGIGREEAMSPDGRPLRTLVISGHDCGCAFTIMQVTAINAIASGRVIFGNNLGGAWGAMLLTSGANMNGNNLSVPEFVKLCARTVEPILNQWGLMWGFDVDHAPEDEQVSVQSMPSYEGPVWNALSRLVDQPWNEVFVREGEQYPEVVCRKTPWIDPASSIDIDAATVEAMGSRMREIDMKEVIELRAHRDDSEVVNLVLLRSALAHPYEHPITMMAPDDPTFESEENSPSVFGWRATQLESMVSRDGAPQGSSQEEYDRLAGLLTTFLRERREWIKTMWGRNADFERGSVQLRGRSTINAGDYIHVRRGVDWVAYVTRVTHQYNAFGVYTTTLEYIRSNQYLRRLQASNPWDTERKRTAT